MSPRKTLPLALVAIATAAVGYYHLAAPPAGAPAQPSDAPKVATTSHRASSAPAVVRRPATTLQPGLQLRYRIDTQHAVVLGAPATSEHLLFSLGGTLTATATSVTPAQSRWELRLSELSLAIGIGADDSGTFATAAYEAFHQDLARPFYVDRASDGHIQTAYFHPELSPVAEGLLRGAITTLQFVHPSDDADQAAWSTPEQDSAGEYIASYTKQDDGYQRTKAPYAQLATPEGLVPTGQLGAAEVHSTSSFQLWNNELVASSSIADRYALTHHSGLRTATESQLDAQLEATGVDHTAPQRDSVAGYRASPLAAVRPGLDNEGDRYRELLGDATFSDLAAELAALDPADTEARHALFDRLIAMLTLHPETATEALTLLRAEQSNDRISLVLGALSSAETVEGERAVAAYAADPTAPTTPRAQAAGLLGMTAAPTAATVAYLRTTANTEQGNLQHAAILGLGNASSRLADPTEQRKIVDELLDRYRSTSGVDRRVALGALGNAGDPAILPAVTEALQSSSATIRAHAVSALRKVDSDAARELIAVTMQTDVDPSVRLAAIEAATSQPVERMLPALVRALQADPEPGVRGGAAVALGRYAQAHPAAQAALAQAAHNDPDDNVRAQALPFVQG